MGIEGFLDIQLTMNESVICDVEILSSRPVYASQVFVGKPVIESLNMLPLLFSICGVAQACAGIRACEQALGHQISSYAEQVRDKLVRMETLREHLWRIFLDWPNFLENQSLNKKIQTQTMSDIIKCQQDYRKFLTSGSNPFLLEQDISPVSTENSQPIRQLNRLLEKSIFAMSPAQWLEIDTIEKLQYWYESSETVTANLLKKIHQNEWQGLGRNNTKGLFTSTTDALESEGFDLSTLREQFEDKNFVKKPQWYGTCCETSSLTRVDSALLQDLYNYWGNGIMSRLVARLTEMAQIAHSLLDDVEQPIQNFSKNRSDILGDGDGIGIVSAARGLLIHHVCIEQSQIEKYQILAPTEWNFHPQGVVAQSLIGLEGGKEQINRQADLLINAIDPCVGYKFHIV